jgi:NADPH-dependent curcumin reductase CurA
MGEWVRSGQVSYKEDIWSGLDKAPEAFAAMLKGDNFGKTLVQISENPVASS